MALRFWTFLVLLAFVYYCVSGAEENDPEISAVSYD